MWMAIAASWACTGSVQSKVVGWSPDGALALVRHERDNEQDEHRAIDLAVIDVATGAEKRRMPILAHDDRSDVAKRGANWKRAEAEATALGIVVQPDLAPVVGVKGVYTLPDGLTLSSRVVSEPSDDPDDPRDALLVDVARGGTPVSSTPPLARWAHYSNANAVHVTRGVWAAPGGAFALVLVGQSCVEPTFHSVKLPGSPSAQ